LTFSVEASLRRLKPEKWRTQLIPRPQAQLEAAVHIPRRASHPVMLDTNVYIHSAAKTLPPAIAWLAHQNRLYHCSVCLGELLTGVANADPSQPGWTTLRNHYVSELASLPQNRILTPDAAIWAEASLIAGILARCQNFQRHQRKEALNDALIFLAAAKAGIPVLTADREDFDLIQQIAPIGRFIYF